jgi:hypothetical protein
MKSLDSLFFCKIAFTDISKSTSIHFFKFVNKSPNVSKPNLDTWDLKFFTLIILHNDILI